MGCRQDAGAGFDNMVDLARDNPEGINIETGIGFV